MSITRLAYYHIDVVLEQRKLKNPMLPYMENGEMKYANLNPERLKYYKRMHRCFVCGDKARFFALCLHKSKTIDLYLVSVSNALMYLQKERLDPSRKQVVCTGCINVINGKPMSKNYRIIEKLPLSIVDKELEFVYTNEDENIICKFDLGSNKQQKFIEQPFCSSCEEKASYYAVVQNKTGKFDLCLFSETDTLMTIDHIVPKSCSGPNFYKNLQTMCLICNANKADRLDFQGLNLNKDRIVYLTK